MSYKLGSLFDGIGGFPLAGMRHGFEPVWASEIEPFPIRVTTQRFPQMKHLSDITQINGAEIEPVDVISGGSPCQDLSVAGKRAGLAGARSGLYMEQIRIVGEMRNATAKRSNGLIQPRFMLWENVPGAFSSNKGEDFRAVLEEAARIVDKNAAIPRPPNGKRSTSGAIMGTGWSIAWRVLDAQFWGVPQHRRRIFLVADFGGHAAPEILFEREGVSGDIAESRAEREGATRDAAGGIGAASCYLINTQIITRHQSLGRGTGFGMGEDGDPAYTLQAGHEHGVITYSIGGFNSEGMLSPNPHAGIYEADTSRTLDLNGGNPACNQGGIAVVCNKVEGTLDASYYKGTGSRNGREREIVAAVDCRNGTENADVNGTLQAKSTGGMSLNLQNTVRQHQSVRRLTPLECERLQGFPDGWTDIEWTVKKLIGKNPKRKNIPMEVRIQKASDSARYKALGNSVAIPCVDYVLEGIAEVLKRG